MPFQSHAYAVGRVRGLEKTLLSHRTLERLVAAPGPSEVTRVLADIGWGEADSLQEIDRLASAHIEEVCALIRRWSPDSAVTDCFLLKYDCLNLKLLLKARTLGRDAETLSGCGTMDPQLLRRCVSQRKYAELPGIFARACEQIEAELAISVNPLRIDTLLDQALFAQISKTLTGVKDPVILSYFSQQVDMLNLIISMRAKRLGISDPLELLLPGGALCRESIAAAKGEPRLLLQLCAPMPYAGAMKAGFAALSETGALAALEKAMDNHLLSMIRAHRFEPTSILPLVGYLLAREREASAVRLIYTARLSGVSDGVIAERLRDLYA